MNEHNYLPSYYAILPATIRYDIRLTPNAKLLYAEITALSNECGYCFARNIYFSELYNVDTRTIQRWVSTLEKCKYVKVTVTYKKGTKIVEKRIISIIVDPMTKMSPPS